MPNLYSAGLSFGMSGHRHQLLSAAQVLSSAPPGATVHYVSYAMHLRTITHPNGMRAADYSSLWTWASNNQRDLPPPAHIAPDANLVLGDLQPAFMFDPRVISESRLPWAHGQQPPPALMPPDNRGWFRRLLGGPGR